MGLFSGIGDLFSGSGGARAAREASQAQTAQLRSARQLFDPFVNAGIEAVPDVTSASTFAGFGQNIGDILDSQLFERLLGDRTRRSEAALSQAGLRRSGTAAREAARIPTDLALSIEGELNRRRQNVANTGFAGAGQQANLSNLIGQALSGGIIGEQRARGAGAANTLNLFGRLLGAF